MPTFRDRVSAFFSPTIEDSLFSSLSYEYTDIGRRALLPEWYFQAPYGQPRRVDIAEIRELAKQPFVHMCIKNIVDDFATTPWEVAPKDPHNFDQTHIDFATDFLLKPNKNKETLSDLMRQWGYDVLSIDAGVLVKVFTDESYETEKSAGMTNKNNYFLKGKDKGDAKSTEKLKVIDVNKAYRPLKETREMVELYCRDGCLDYKQHIDTDMGRIHIGEIVNDKLKVSVKSYNIEKGIIEYRPITNWFKNGSTTEWYRIKSLTGEKYRSLTLTGNHKIYTKNGYKLVQDLSMDDILYTYSEKISKDEEQIIIGSLLGDGSLSSRNGHERHYFEETHGIKQKKYLLYKFDCLSRYNPIYREYKSSFGEGYPETVKCNMRTRANISFNKYFDLKYPNFSNEIFDLLDLRGLAIWIQDDGYCYPDRRIEDVNKRRKETPSRMIELSTHCFDIKVLEYAQKVLKEKFGYETKIRKDNRFEDSYILYFTTKYTEKLIEDIKDYIHPSMAYKVGLKENEVGSKIDIEKAIKFEPIEVPILSIEKIYQTPKCGAKYDIEVADNHNYFAQGKLVSNSTFLADGDYTGFVHRYFQYAFKIPRRAPQIFDRNEIVYTMMSPRSYSFYGWSPIQSIEDVVRMLKEQVIYNLTIFKEKGVPDGLISIMDISKVELKRLREYWRKDIKGKHHKFGVIGREAKFTPITLTARDMEVISSQQWFIKLVMALFNINIPILSLKGEAPRAGTWALLKRERHKAVIPLLQLFEYEINAEVLSEFEFDDIEFKFKTYDIEEDKMKREMDRQDAEAGILTINEIREKERALDPVAWGEEPFNSMTHAMRTGGMPMTQMPKSLEKNKPTLDEFGKKLMKVK